MSDYRELNAAINDILDVTIEKLVAAGMKDEFAALRGITLKSIAYIDGYTCPECKREVLGQVAKYIDHLLSELGDAGEHEVLH